MNPPSIILGGGVHGKACWLIAYLYYEPVLEINNVILSYLISREIFYLSAIQRKIHFLVSDLLTQKHDEVTVYQTLIMQLLCDWSPCTPQHRTIPYTPCTPNYTMYSLHTVLHHVHTVHHTVPCTACTPYCTMYTLYTVRYHVHPVHRTVPCTPCTQYCTMYSLYTVLCTVSLQMSMLQ